MGASFEVREFFSRRNIKIDDVKFVYDQHKKYYTTSPLRLTEDVPKPELADAPAGGEKGKPDELADKAGKSTKDTPKASVVGSTTYPEGDAKANSGQSSTGGKVGGYGRGSSGSGK